MTEKRILLVDASSFKIGLEQYGFKVTTYNDPVLALSEFKIALFDLLLVDIRMPGMTGLELYEKIKNIDHKIEVCFILKPIAISELAKKINTILNVDS